MEINPKHFDVVSNIKYIDKIEPGQILEFSMYPDHSVTDDVFYYSCFAPIDSTVVPVTAKKNGGDFDFRYDSGAWYSAAKFNDEGTALTMRGYNSYPLETYANFEFPQISGKEKFNVTVNDKPVKFIQSIDDMGFWHGCIYCRANVTRNSKDYWFTFPLRLISTLDSMFPSAEGICTRACFPSSS